MADSRRFRGTTSRPGEDRLVLPGRSRLEIDPKKVDRGELLNKDQQEAKRCLGFLTRVSPENYLFYPHQPDRGQFCVVRVTDEYDYSAKEDSLDGFRSSRPCELITTEPVAMYDEIVPDQFRQRLGRPGRFSEVYDTGPLS